MPTRAAPVTARRGMFMVAVNDTIDNAGTDLIGMEGFVWSAIGDAESRSPGAFTAIALAISLDAALVGSETLTIALSIGGVDSALVATFNSGTGRTVVATGSVAVADGDRLSLHATFGGGLASANVVGYSLGFDAPAAFPNRAKRLNFTTDSGNFTLLGHRQGDDFLTNSDFPAGCDWNPLPAALSVTRLALQATPTPTGTFSFQPRTQIPGVDSGSPVVIAATTTAAGDITLSGSAPTLATDLATTAFECRATRTAGAGNIVVRTMSAYAAASPNADWCVLASGFNDSNLFTAVDTYFVPVGSSYVFLTEAGAQIPCAVAGTFRYLLTAVEGQDTSSDSDYEFALRVNGVSSTVLTTMTNTDALLLARENTATVHVAAGDLVAFQAFTSGPQDIGHRLKPYFAVGFLAD